MFGIRPPCPASEPGPYRTTLCHHQPGRFGVREKAHDSRPEDAREAREARRDRLSTARVLDAGLDVTAFAPLLELRPEGDPDGHEADEKDLEGHGVSISIRHANTVKKEVHDFEGPPGKRFPRSSLRAPEI